MSERNRLRVLILHSDYSDHPGHNPFFGRNGVIHKNLQKAIGKEIQWHFFGGFITENRKMFWEKISRADILLCPPSNMDNTDVNMHWDHAEIDMIKQIEKIKKLNPKIKIIYFDRAHFLTKKLQRYGKFIKDIHDIEAMAEIINT